MDYVLFALVIFFALKGAFKGFLSMLFSLFGLFAVAFLSWRFCDVFVPTLQGFFGDNLQNSISDALNSAISGEFSSVGELVSAISSSSIFKFFGLALESILGEISFSETMTAGEILAPTLANLALKVISFVCLFFILSLIFKVVSALLRKVISLLGFSFGNRILGLAFGAAEGLAIFSILYLVLLSLSNFILSETLLSFLQSGQISTFIYDNLISKIVEILT